MKNRRIWEQVNEYAAGVDAGAEHHYVAVPENGDKETVGKFETTTLGLYMLADWLAEHKIETVAVESTGVYSVPLIEVLERRGFKVVLAKPTVLKEFNDKQKTDMLDCQWIQLLHSFGLIKASFRPTEEIAVYRVYYRHRQNLVEECARQIQRMKKSLIQMNIRLDQAVTDVTGVTGMEIIRAIIAGERDPIVLAGMRQEGCAKSEGKIAEYLRGKWEDEHLFTLGQAVASWDHYQSQIRECDEKLEALASKMTKQASREQIPAARSKEKPRKNQLTFNARELFYEVLGQDLTQIDGISVATISVFMAEVGLNVNDFATEKKFCSWLRGCPGSNLSGGRNRSGRNRKTSNRLMTALHIAAQTLARSKSALGAFYRRKRAQLGPQKANGATAHKLARMIYQTLKQQRPYVDPGENYYLERNHDRMLKSLKKRAMLMGFELVKAA